MPIKAPFSAPPAAPTVPAKPAPVAEKPQPSVPAERELAARLIAARDRLLRAIEGDRAETVPMEKHGALHRALLRAVRAAGLWPLLQQRDPAAPRSRDDQAEDATEEQAA